MSYRNELHGIDSDGVWPEWRARTEETSQHVLSEYTLFLLTSEANRAHDKHKDHGGSILDPSLSTERRLAALGEEFGEVCRELTYDNSGDPEKLKKELTQLANVAMTWVEFLLRQAAGEV